MASPIVETWTNATVMLESASGTGTGFFVAEVLDAQRAHILLVTNKHVIADSPAQRAATTGLTVHFNTTDSHGAVAGDRQAINFDYADIAREHPDPDVDVAVLNITGLVTAKSNMSYAAAKYEDFADAAKVAELDITVGEDVFTVGYPLGIRHRLTNHPVIRGGIIATRLGEELEDQVRDAGGHLRTRRLRGFLIDGGTVPGSSGSPVVLKPVPGRVVHGNIHIGITPPVLLGIVAETRYAPIRTPAGAVPSFAGLGLAFDAATIRETIGLFD